MLLLQRHPRLQPRQAGTCPLKQQQQQLVHMRCQMQLQQVHTLLLVQQIQRQQGQ
jgi:hypothetical protein